MNRQEHMTSTSRFVVNKLPCAHGRGRARMTRDWAATQRTVSGARPAEKTSALVATRADALTYKTTTHRFVSPVSDPSELGSEPDSWLTLRCLRAHERSRWCVREQRLGSHAPNQQRSTAS
jgi:hypothetical protein